MPGEPRFIKVVVTFERREDGGLRAYSADAPGLHLSGPDPESVFRDVIPALETLIGDGGEAPVRFGPVVAATALADPGEDGLSPPRSEREEREYAASIEQAA